VKLLDDSGRTVDALTYLVDRNHAQYAGALPLEEQLRLVRGGKGQSGANIDYVLNTLRHLEAEGVHDPRLAALASRLSG
jgi:cation transport protein ChaC